MKYTRDRFILDISRETLEDFETYNKLLIKWQNSINLISFNTVQEIWHRHIADSAQLYKYIGDNLTICDIGSGGGFPAIVCAILVKNYNKNIKFVLIESDRRKCIFLNETIRVLKLNCVVINERVERCNISGFDMMTSRALTNINNLLIMGELLKLNQILILKGLNWKQEIFDAEKNWIINYKNYNSMTEKGAQIIFIKNFLKN